MDCEFAEEEEVIDPRGGDNDGEEENSEDDAVDSVGGSTPAGRDMTQSKTADSFSVDERTTASSSARSAACVRDSCWLCSRGCAYSPRAFSDADARASDGVVAGKGEDEGGCEAGLGAAETGMGDPAFAASSWNIFSSRRHAPMKLDHSPSHESALSLFWASSKAGPPSPIAGIAGRSTPNSIPLAPLNSQSNQTKKEGSCQMPTPCPVQ